MNILKLIHKSLLALNFLHYDGYLKSKKKDTFLHCDIKPGNMMLLIDNGSFTVKFVDLATLVRESESLVATITTPGYSSPYFLLEANKNRTVKNTKADDIWSLAITFF